MLICATDFSKNLFTSGLLFTSFTYLLALMCNLGNLVPHLLKELRDRSQ
ncbi:MAG TPA: hypothetical protein V6D10_06755 [Trichocoleus sp.]